MTTPSVSPNGRSLRGGLRDQQRSIVLILVVALVVRAALVLALAQWEQPPNDRTTRYDPIAESLIRGEGFSRSGQPSAAAAPLYPLMLAGTYTVFGKSATAARAVLAGFDIVHCLIWIAIAMVVFGPSIGRTVGWLMALCPYFLYLLMTAGSDALFLPFQGLFVLSIVWALENDRLAPNLVGGLALGLACLCRAVPLLLPLFVMPAYLLRPGRRGIVGWLLMCVAFVATLTPWTIRNWIHFGGFVPVQTLGGYHLYIESGVSRDEVRGGGSAGTRSRRSSVEGDRSYTKAAIEQIVRNPGTFIKRASERLVRMWYVTHSGRYSTVLVIANSVLLLLAGVGAYFARSRWRSLLPLLLLIVYYVGLHSVMVAIFRYMVTVVPALLVLCAVTVVAALGTWRGQRETEI